MDSIQTILINAINAKWPELNARAACVDSDDIIVGPHTKLPGWKLRVLADRVALDLSFNLDTPEAVGEIPRDGSFSCMMKMRDKFEVLFSDPQLLDKVIADIAGHLDDSIWPVGLSIDISKIVNAAGQEWKDAV